MNKNKNRKKSGNQVETANNGGQTERQIGPIYMMQLNSLQGEIDMGMDGADTDEDRLLINFARMRRPIQSQFQLNQIAHANQGNLGGELDENGFGN